MTSRLLRRYGIVFVLLSLAAATLVELGEQDRLSFQVENWSLVLLAPGFLIRALASRSELGFHDWRDLVLTAGGSAATFTIIIALLDRAFRKRRVKSGAPLSNER